LLSKTELAYNIRKRLETDFYGFEHVTGYAKYAEGDIKLLLDYIAHLEQER